MQPNQQQHRQQATQEFEEALEHLQDILQGSTDDEEIPDIAIGDVNSVEQNEDVTDTDLAVWEDAVADIEQYLEEKTKNL